MPLSWHQLCHTRHMGICAVFQKPTVNPHPFPLQCSTQFWCLKMQDQEVLLTPLNSHRFT